MILPFKSFYLLKPLIPRKLQIGFRRKFIQFKRKFINYNWPIDPLAGNPPQGWSGWPQGKQFAVVLSHDVDTQRGHDHCRRLINLEENLGFRSSCNFVPEKYDVSEEVRKEIIARGFEVGVHGLKHDGKLFFSEKIFKERALRINQYLKEWGAGGFTSPSAHHNLGWMQALNMEYDISTFDTDPFEPQPDGVGTIFPFLVQRNPGEAAASQLPSLPGSRPPSFFIELPYTLPQDFTLFVIMREQTIGIWKQKLDWIAEKGGMALLNSHPDYMSFNASDQGNETYPVKFYTEFLEYIKSRYKGKYWQALPGEVARFFAATPGRQEAGRLGRQKAEDR